MRYNGEVFLISNGPNKRIYTQSCVHICSDYVFREIKLERRIHIMYIMYIS